MAETEHFVNEGFGWECLRCRDEAGTDPASPASPMLPRFFREGEAEEGGPRLSSRALARWKDATRRTLCCTRCGVEEVIVE